MFSTTLKYSRDAYVLLVYLLFSVPACLLLRETVLPLPGAGQAAAMVDPAGQSLPDAEAFARLLEEYGISLGQVMDSQILPGVYPMNLPENLGTLSVGEKSSLFISLVLPNILRVNKEIRATRQRMLQLLDRKASFRRLTEKEKWWLNRLARQYGCSADDADELKLRVDTVPVALALAQAITESGWGTSRFARLGNALYGQHLPESSNGEYILSRSGKVKMAVFSSIYDATRSYILTINRVRAYSDLRRQRAELRAEGRRLSGLELAGQLTSYSEIGSNYVSDLRYLITRYELERFNGVRLAEQDSGQVIRFQR